MPQLYVYVTERLNDTVLIVDRLVLTTCATDPRRRNKLLHDPRRPSPTTPDRPAPCQTTGSGHAEVHRRYRRRCLSVQPHKSEQHKRQQPNGQPRRRCRLPHPRTAGSRSARCQRPRQGRSHWYSATWIWWRWAGWQPEQDGAHHGGSGHGGWGVRGECQEERVLPLIDGLFAWL